MLKGKKQRFKLTTRLGRLDEQCTPDRHHVMRWTLGESTVALSCIPASYPKMQRPIITGHCDHHAQNALQSFPPKKVFAARVTYRTGYNNGNHIMTSDNHICNE